MRNIILMLALFIVSVSANSQQRISKKALAELKENLEQSPLLKDDETDFKTALAATKWKDESAVILCQKTSFDYDKKGLSVGKRIGRNLVGLLFALPTFGASIYTANVANETKILIEEKERRKILLNDRYAIDQYSMLYFRNESDKDAFDARVFKTDGTVQKISLDEAVRVENLSSVPDIFKSYTDERFSSYYRPVYYKVVVPDLQEGDIIEYEFINYNVTSYFSNPNLKEFTPIYYLCNRSLPVEKQILQVSIQNDNYRFGYKSLKGAPDFVQTSENGRQVYKWTDVAREKMPDIRYINKNIEMPSVKFQVVYSKRSSNDYMFLNKSGEQKEDLSEAQFSDKAKLLWFSTSDANIPTDWKYNEEDAVKSIFKELKKAGVTENSDDDYVRKMYYTIRSKTFFNNMNDYAFAKLFAGLLEKKKLTYEIIATNSNNLSSIKDLAFIREIQWAIKYNNKFYCNPAEHLNPGEIPFWLNGNKAVAFGRDEKTAASGIIIPTTDTTTNKMLFIEKTSLNIEAMELAVDESVQASGLSKHSVIDDVLAFTPFIENDNKNYDGPSLLDEMSEKQRTEAEELLAKERKEWKETKPEMMKELIENKYSREVSGTVAFKLVNDGRSFKKPDLTYTQKFSLKKMVAHAGNDLIISIPAIIGDQSKIKPEERTRTSTADLSFARTNQWKIYFTIPAGYTLQGINQLNQSIRNDAGVFESTATVENNELVLQVKKQYSTKYLDAAKWQQMVQMLDAAFNWSQARLILKKQ